MFRKKGINILNNYKKLRLYLQKYNRYEVYNETFNRLKAFQEKKMNPIIRLINYLRLRRLAKKSYKRIQNG